jgi:hypothetical protein
MHHFGVGEQTIVVSLHLVSCLDAVLLECLILHMPCVQTRARTLVINLDNNIEDVLIFSEHFMALHRLPGTS